jgi:hypothetical protein
MLRIFYTDTPFIPPRLRIGHSLQIMEAMLLLFSYYKQYRSGWIFFLINMGVRVSLRAPRLIPRILKLPII